MYPKNLLIAVGLPVTVLSIRNGVAEEFAGQVTGAGDTDLVSVTALRPGATTLLPLAGVVFKYSRAEGETAASDNPGVMVCFLPESAGEREEVGDAEEGSVAAPGGESGSTNDGAGASDVGGDTTAAESAAGAGALGSGDQQADSSPAAEEGAASDAADESAG